MDKTEQLCATFTAYDKTPSALQQAEGWIDARAKQGWRLVAMSGDRKQVLVVLTRPLAESK